MNWKMTMNSFRFLLRKKVDGKTFSFTDHLSIADESKSLYITKAMDYFDLSTKKGELSKVFNFNDLSYLFVTFSSDWLFPTSETKTIIRSLNQSKAKLSFAEINSDKGHDAFLLDEPNFHSTLKSFITGQKKRLKI